MKKRSLIQFWAVCIAMLTTMPTNIAFCQNVPDPHYYGADTAFDHVNYFSYLSNNLYIMDTNTKILYPILANRTVIAFTIQSTDLFKALGVPEQKISEISEEPNFRPFVRTYLGLDTTRVQPDKLKPNFDSSIVGFKLFVVPVASDSADMVFNRNGNEIDPNPVKANCYKHDKGCLKDMFVLDLNSPCPRLCSFPSIFLDTKRYGTDAEKKSQQSTKKTKKK